MINFQAILWPADPMRRRRGEWTFEKFTNKMPHKIFFYQKYSPFFAISPNQHLCHKVCLGKCMYCWAYPKPQKTEALKRHWRNEIILAQHIPYQHSNPKFDQEHQHILQECNNMWQIFGNIHFSWYWFVSCLKANGGVEKEVLESYCWMYSTWNIPRVSQKYHRKYS